MEKNKLMMIVIILILAIMLAAVGFGFAYTIKMIQSVQKPPEPTLETQTESQEYDIGEMRLIEIAEPIKANLLPENDGVEHLALVSVSVGIAGPMDVTKKEKKNQVEELDELELALVAKEPVVRDLIIRQLRKSTHSELRRIDGQEILEHAITSELQNTFSTNYIVNVFFKELFLQ